MKTIEQAAKEYAEKILSNYINSSCSIDIESCKRDFIAGAKFRLEYFTNWRNPEIEIPPKNTLILLKTNEGICTGYFWGGREFGVCMPWHTRGLSNQQEYERGFRTCNVISWRPIN